MLKEMQPCLFCYVACSEKHKIKAEKNKDGSCAYSHCVGKIGYEEISGAVSEKEAKDCQCNGIEADSARYAHIA